MLFPVAKGLALNPFLAAFEQISQRSMADIVGGKICLTATEEVVSSGTEVDVVERLLGPWKDRGEERWIFKDDSADQLGCIGGDTGCHEASRGVAGDYCGFTHDLGQELLQVSPEGFGGVLFGNPCRSPVTVAIDGKDVKVLRQLRQHTVPALPISYLPVDEEKRRSVVRPLRIVEDGAVDVDLMSTNPARVTRQASQLA
jgi:hypothetical protein